MTEGPAASLSPRVLVVDDERGIRLVMTRILTKNGFDVVACECGEDAIRLMTDQATRIDIIVTDLTMPGLHGADFVSALRAVAQEVPIVVMTGNRSAHDEVTLDSLGIAACIDKPIDAMALVQTLRQSL